MSTNRQPAATAEADRMGCDHSYGLEELSHAVRYRRYLFDLLTPYLTGSVLEVGAGQGDLVPLFDDTQELILTDVDPQTVAGLRDRFRERPRTEIRTFDLNGEPLGIQAGSALAINVLEHIEDDVTALRAIADSVTPGASIVVLVPGYPALYGPFDRMVGHVRRYTPASLRAAVEDAGLSVTAIRPVNFIGGIAWWIAVKLGKRVRPRPTLVRFYDRFLVPIVRLIERRWRPPFGQSVMCVARTPDGR